MFAIRLVVLGFAVLSLAGFSTPTSEAVHALAHIASVDGNCGECTDCGAAKGHSTEVEASGVGVVGRHPCTGPGTVRHCDDHGTCSGGVIPGGDDPELLTAIATIESITAAEADQVVTLAGGRAWVNEQRQALQLAGCTPGSVKLSLPINR
jgi:hypothetical protein